MSGASHNVYPSGKVRRNVSSRRAALHYFKGTVTGWNHDKLSRAVANFGHGPAHRRTFARSDLNGIAVRLCNQGIERQANLSALAAVAERDPTARGL